MSIITWFFRANSHSCLFLGVWCPIQSKQTAIKILPISTRNMFSELQYTLWLLFALCFFFFLIIFFWQWICKILKFLNFRNYQKKMITTWVSTLQNKYLFFLHLFANDVYHKHKLLKYNLFIWVHLLGLFLSFAINFSSICLHLITTVTWKTARHMWYMSYLVVKQWILTLGTAF